MKKSAEHLIYEKPSFLCSWKLCPGKEKKLFNYKLQIITLLPTGSSVLRMKLKMVSKKRLNDYTEQAPEFTSVNISPPVFIGKKCHISGFELTTIIRNKSNLIALILRQ